MKSTTAMALLAGPAIGAAISAPAVAQTQQRDAYDLPAQNLGASLRQVGRTGHVEILFTPDDVAGIVAPAIHGDLTLSAALERLLDGTGLRARYANGTFVIRRASQRRARPAASETVAGAALATTDGPDILVTGSRIRGAPIASPVITLSADTIRAMGQSNLGEVARSLPQGFAGGQNPGIGISVPASGGVNVGGGSTFNLRGLGSDATLTLLNGHRLTYTGATQGIDVSAIPLDAVDRVEIVPDGSSALYGSDAVTGVVNVLLKRDFSGLETRARFTGATEGAYTEQQYGAVAGTRWVSGGILAAYEYASNTRIQSDDRSFADTRPGVTIYPAQRRHALAVTGHQALTDTLTFTLDALYNKRWNSTAYPQNAAGNLSVSRVEQDTVDESWALAPSLAWAMSGGWRATLSGTYGRENSRTDVGSFVGTVRTPAFVCYCNSGASAELGIDGALFRLPAGAAKIAVGAGYRHNALDAFRGAGNSQNVERSQDDYYGYGELALPLIGSDMAVPGIERLTASAAVRYERYPGIGSIATPKLGLIYAPTADFDLKGSWGTSFRAPTLIQQYQARTAILYKAATLGGTGYPANATALFLSGGNPDLTPERAKTWTATVDLHPRALAGAHLSLSYFATLYENRIVTPITVTAQSLSNPAYAFLLTARPSGSQQAAVIGSALNFFNVSGATYDPATVVAFVNDSNVNAGRQSIEGVDMLAEYQFDLGRRDRTLGLLVDATYLRSNQQLLPGQAVQQRAGLLYNPPNWRARAGVSWRQAPFSVSATISYVGGVEDIRTAIPVAVGSMTTLDLTARYAFRAAHGPLHGTEIALSGQNMFNARPAVIASTSFADSTYDSTNYSPFGRVLGVEVRKSW